MQDEQTVPVSQSIDLGSMQVEESYKGPRMEGDWCSSSQQGCQLSLKARCAHRAGDHEQGFRVSEAFVDSMLERFRERGLIHSRFAFEIVMAVRGVAASLGAVLQRSSAAAGCQGMPGTGKQVSALAGQLAHSARYTATAEACSQSNRDPGYQPLP